MNKKLILVVSAFTLASGVFFFQVSFAKDSIKKATFSTPKQATKEQTEWAIVDEVNYDVKKPKFVPKGLNAIPEQDSRFGQLSDDSLYVTKQGWIDPSNERRNLLIIQSNDDGSKKPIEELSEGKKVSIAGVDAWIINSSTIKIMLWKDGKYYHVRGENLPETELIKVTKSLFQ